MSTPEQKSAARTVRGGLLAIALAVPAGTALFAYIFGVHDTGDLSEWIAAVTALFVGVVALAIEFRRPPSVSEMNDPRGSLAYLRDVATSIVAPFAIVLFLVLGEHTVTDGGFAALLVVVLAALAAAHWLVKRGAPVIDDQA